MNPQNLKPFIKGDKRINRKGAPKLPDLTEIMAKVMGDEQKGKSAAEAIIIAMRTKAKRGDIRAADFLFDRGYGKPKQEIEQHNTGDQIIRVIREEPNKPLDAR